MADIYEVRITGVYFGQHCMNVLHLSGPDNGHTLAQVNDIVRTQFVIEIKALQNEHFLYTNVESRKISPTTSTPEALSLAGFTGDLVGEGAHPSIAGLFTIQTATAGRKGRGRFYMPGVHQQSIQDGIVQASAKAAYDTKAGIISTRFGTQATSGMNIGVKRKAPPVSFTAMQQMIARPTFGIIRRRNVGVGN